MEKETAKVVCPYYLIQNEEELDVVRKSLGYSMERLHEFPFIIGIEPNFIFQEPGKKHPMKPYKDDKENKEYVYELKEVPKRG